MDGFLDRYIGARFYYIWYTLLLPPHCDWGIIYCISTFLMTHSVSLCKARRVAAAAALHGVVPVVPTGPIYVCPSWKVWTLAHKGTNGWNMSLAALLHCKKKHYVQANQFQRVPFVYLLPSKNLNNYHST